MSCPGADRSLCRYLLALLEENRFQYCIRISWFRSARLIPWWHNLGSFRVPATLLPNFGVNTNSLTCMCTTSLPLCPLLNSLAFVPPVYATAAEWRTKVTTYANPPVFRLLSLLAQFVAYVNALPWITIIWLIYCRIFHHNIVQFVSEVLVYYSL